VELFWIFLGFVFGALALLFAALAGVCAEEVGNAKEKGDIENANVSAKDGTLVATAALILWLISVWFFFGGAN
jgi:hypothetical protein